MEKKLLDNIRQMFASKDHEMWALARKLFWTNDPSIEDHDYVVPLAPWSDAMGKWEEEKKTHVEFHLYGKEIKEED